jgi:hypothetical protein
VAKLVKVVNRKIGKRPQSLEFLHSDYDARILCRYILVSLKIPDFLQMIKHAYESQGAIEGQRDVVRTATATRIRRRMASDLATGAILPPIVLGAVAKLQQINVSDWDTDSVSELVTSLRSKLSVIDGMQRTTVMRDHEADLTDKSVRVELWLAPSTENLVYRMLVLNTGQIPWNLRRQLEVVHRSLIEEIRASLIGELSIYKADDRKRRTQAGEFQANEILEMYLAFNLRKPHVDKENVLADQFSKLDLIEAVSRPTGLEGFVAAMRVLLALDRLFSRTGDLGRGTSSRYSSGRNIFDKLSACTGFMAAYSQYVFGKVGLDRDADQQASYVKKLKRGTDALVKKYERGSAQQVREFLALDTLEEVSEKRAGALSIGEQERELFLSAFKLLFEESEHLKTMEPCWRSQ